MVFHFRLSAPTYTTPLKSFHKVGLESSSTGSSFPADSQARSFGRDDEAFGYLKRVIVTPVVYLRLVEFLHFDIQRTGQKSHCVNIHRDHCNALFSLNSRFPLSVPFPSWVFDARGRPPNEPFPIRPPTDTRRPALTAGAARAVRRQPTGSGSGPPAHPSSQSFSRSYGSILPTSLAYIVPSTEGCSPWRPDAVMSTIGHGLHSVLWIFKGRRERTEHYATCGALPAAGPYLCLSHFQGGQASDERFARQYRCGPPPEFPLASPRSGIVHHLSGPDRYAHTRTFLRRSRSVGGAPLRGIPPISFFMRYGFTRPLTRTHVRLFGPCFKTGRMGSPQASVRSSQMPMHAVGRALPATIGETAFRGCIENPDFGRPPNPR
ncbi:hypothetical protein RND71_008092 [Anisodus tanguticus]|uniref:Uncharacterized protein n=1 Tax=Anisodus tanguticus TaxID=243964 RepID=A0AAE1SNI1_9SOLA|nr:hypothetical protein RND71_008092 [Anisodus tanguticus]